MLASQARKEDGTWRGSDQSASCYHATARNRVVTVPCERPEIKAHQICSRPWVAHPADARPIRFLCITSESTLGPCNRWVFSTFLYCLSVHRKIPVTLPTTRFRVCSHSNTVALG